MSDLESKQKQQSKNKKLYYLFYFVFLLGLAEIFSFTVGTILQSKWGMYKDPVPQSGKGAISYTKYLEIRDPDLGWPRTEEFGGKVYDNDGARWCLESGVDNPQRWTMSLYGDSYTADHIGGNTDHWGCRLQRFTGTKVRNYGIGGYGTDQALIRYLNNKNDKAEIVILGHMSDDISRNLTRYRDFQMYAQNWAFKPRFIIDDNGKLKHIPMPSLSSEEYTRFLALEKPQLILPHENFHPNGPSGAVRLTFPYTIAIIRNLGFWGLQSKLHGLPTYAAFYDVEHPFQGLQITAGIMKRFAHEAQLRGQKALLVLFPGEADLDYFRKNNKWLYQNLIDELQREGLEPLNFGETLIAHLEGRPVSEAFGTGSDSKRFHYNQEVSHLVADTILQHIKESNLLAVQDRIEKN